MAVTQGKQFPGRQDPPYDLTLTRGKYRWGTLEGYRFHEILGWKWYQRNTTEKHDFFKIHQSDNMVTRKFLERESIG